MNIQQIERVQLAINKAGGVQKVGAAIGETMGKLAAERGRLITAIIVNQRSVLTTDELRKLSTETLRKLAEGLVINEDGDDAYTKEMPLPEGW